MLHHGDDRRRLQATEARWRDEARVPLIAVNDVLYHAAGAPRIAGCRHLHPRACHARQGGQAARSQCRAASEIAAGNGAPVPRCARSDRRDVALCRPHRFSLDQLKYNYPDEPVPHGQDAQTASATISPGQGATRRYPDGMPDKVRATLEKELALIAKLEYRALFPHRARHRRLRASAQDILCQGRGSAANSAVCYVLGITAVDPDADRSSVRAFHLAGAQGAARHRCRFRA